MSSWASGGDAAGACVSCLRRSWLLSALSALLDFCARDRDRLMEVLGLEDELLIAAVAGRRKRALSIEHAAFAPDQLQPGGEVRTICRHQTVYPPLLGAGAAPHMLHVLGHSKRIQALATEPVVAIVGSRRASDYGVEMAASLARGLCASGVTVVGGIGEGIALAAHAGALEAGGATVAVGGNGLGCWPVRRRGLLERVKREGLAISELPCACSGQRWGQLASQRTIVGLAALTIVVEAQESAEDLAPARIARALGRPVAAIPGRLTSPLSRGTNALLMEGASLLRGAQDALDLLYRVAERQPSDRPRAQPDAHTGACGRDGPSSTLEPRLRRMLERVGAGEDTPQKLAREDSDPAETLLALSELELMGLVRRSDGGRYVPRQPWHLDN